MQVRQRAILAEALEVVPVQEVLLGPPAAEEQPRLARRAGKVGQLPLPVLQEAPARHAQCWSLSLFTSGRLCPEADIDTVRSVTVAVPTLVQSTGGCNSPEGRDAGAGANEDDRLAEVGGRVERAAAAQEDLTRAPRHANEHTQKTSEGVVTYETAFAPIHITDTHQVKCRGPDSQQQVRHASDV